MKDIILQTCVVL